MEKVNLFGENENRIGYLYRIIKNNNQNGYVVILRKDESFQVIESRFEGTDGISDIIGNVYYIAPMGFYDKETFYNKLNLSRMKTNIINNYVIANDSMTINSITPTKLIPVPDAHYKTHYDSFTSYQQMLDTPSYLNYSYGPVNNGCGPTTGAMLVAFYDSVSIGTLYNGLLPQLHNGDKEKVDDLIIEMADYMQTCNNISGNLSDPNNCTGTYYFNATTGLTNYFDDNNNGMYNARYSTSISEYKNLIWSKGVAYVRLNDPSGYGNHAVLGIGTANVRYTGNMLIIRDNWNFPEVWVSESIFNGFIYMSK